MTTTIKDRLDKVPVSDQLVPFRLDLDHGAPRINIIEEFLRRDDGVMTSFVESANDALETRWHLIRKLRGLAEDARRINSRGLKIHQFLWYCSRSVDPWWPNDLVCGRNCWFPSLQNWNKELG